MNSNPFKISKFADASLWLLLVSNISVLLLAQDGSWNLLALMSVYWFQSVVIGVFHSIKILKLENFSTEGFKLNGKPVQSTQKTKVMTATFFLLHYGLFHLVYLIFLLTAYFTGIYGSVPSHFELKYVVMASLIFFLNHLFSYLYNRSDKDEGKNIGTFMFYPYARIVPMHITIILGFFIRDALSIFIFLKIIADMIMHIIEHNVNTVIKVEVQSN